MEPQTPLAYRLIIKRRVPVVVILLPETNIFSAIGGSSKRGSGAFGQRHVEGKDYPGDHSGDCVLDI